MIFMVQRALVGTWLPNITSEFQFLVQNMAYRVFNFKIQII